MKLLHGFALASLFFLSQAQAAVTINIQQSGADVVATATGTLNTSGLSGGAASALSLIQYVNPTSYAYLVGQGGANSAIVYPVTFSPGQPLQTTAIDELAGSSIGGIVGVDNNDLYVPAGYLSGGAINATSTWANKTLADLALTPGSYVFTYPVGSTQDSITFTVGTPSMPVTATTVPAMPAWLLGLMAVVLLMLGATALMRVRN